MKEIWSTNYFKHPREGLQNYLSLKVKGYKRQDLPNYIKGFAVFINKPEKKDSVALCQGNFSKWVQYVKSKKLTEIAKNK